MTSPLWMMITGAALSEMKLRETLHPQAFAVSLVRLVPLPVCLPLALWLAGVALLFQILLTMKQHGRYDDENWMDWPWHHGQGVKPF